MSRCYQWMAKGRVTYYSQVYYPYLEDKGLLDSISEQDKVVLRKVREEGLSLILVILQ